MVATFERIYDPAWAESWDAVGLVCGDPEAPVRRVLFAVDPTAAVVDEALEWGADLLVAHHPLLLRPVHGVPATMPKGRVVHRLIGRGVGLYVAHTNADVACPGVSDALADAVGLGGFDGAALRPLAPSAADPSGGRGLGRLGRLPEPVTLATFVGRVAAGLPETPAGLRVAGDPDLPVHTVALCGGAGDSLLDEARAAGADVYLTADLRHHPASESREHGPPALVDASHWATEWPWLASRSGPLTRLLDALAVRGTTVETHISAIVTDAWTWTHRAARGVEIRS
ncbi:MAG: Nif3-like dinuclear metal center hexameric protein [Streptosporangiales bacterium]|nr:Nif3-like dinuclear metal center hexameric protein [Streptosporangiales bacterium]